MKKAKTHAYTDTGLFFNLRSSWTYGQIHCRGGCPGIQTDFPPWPASSSFFNLTGIPARYTYKLTSVQPRVPPLVDQFMACNGTQPAVLTPFNHSSWFRLVSLHITCLRLSRRAY